MRVTVSLLTKLETGTPIVDSPLVVAAFGRALYRLFLKFSCIFAFFAEVVDPGPIS